MRLSGRSEKFGSASLSHEFSTFEIGEPTKPKERLLRHLGKNSIVLDADKYFMLPEDGLRATFIEREDFAQDREDSRHVVRFGQMILNGHGIHEAPDFVAVKPFEDRRELYNEWAANAYLNGIFEDQRAFMPLGILKDGHGTMNLLTLYENGVKTADTVFWADGEAQPEALRPKVVETTANASMYGLGLMHGARIIHGDAQAKNLAWDTRQPRFVDLESAIHVPVDAVGEAVYADKILRDVSTFIYSTMQVDENQDKIADVLSKPTVADKMIKSYKRGIDEARRQQPELTIPDYAAMHEDQTRDILQRTMR